MKQYSKDQIAKHGALMQKWLSDPTTQIEALLTNNIWQIESPPLWSAKDRYREKPTEETQKQMFSKEQLLKHGELILKKMRNPDLVIQMRVDTEEGLIWRDILSDLPQFSSLLKYREKPAPDFVNDLGEEFYHDEKIEETVYWYYFTAGKLHSDSLSYILSTIGEKGRHHDKTTQIAKSELSALELAARDLRSKKQESKKE